MKRSHLKVCYAKESSNLTMYAAHDHIYRVCWRWSNVNPTGIKSLIVDNVILELDIWEAQLLIMGIKPEIFKNQKAII